MTVRTGYEGVPSVPEIDPATCTSCGLCAHVCGLEHIKMVEGAVTIDPDSVFGCIGCGHCMMACPTGSIKVTGRKTSPSDLADVPADEEKTTPESLEALMRARRSVRKFEPVEVDRDVIDDIVRIASTAPMSLPPSDVGVLVISGKKAVREFGDDVLRVYNKYLRLASPVTMPVLRPFLGKAMYGILDTFAVPQMRMIRDKRAKGVDFLFYDAPVVLVFHYLPSALPDDTHIAGTYAMLAAESLGLGSCVIGTPFVLGLDNRLKDKYGIPRANRIGFMLAIGYPAVRYHKAIKREFASVRFIKKP